jgi:hypothetical protein
MELLPLIILLSFIPIIVFLIEFLIVLEAETSACYIPCSILDRLYQKTITERWKAFRSFFFKQEIKRLNQWGSP